MDADKAGRIASLVAAYKGIEGFYILNRAGELGYFSTDGRRLVRETAGSLNADARDATAIRRRDLEHFLAAIRNAFVNRPPDREDELGFLLPADCAQLWQTATVVLHEHVVAEFERSLNRSLSRGAITLDEGERLYSDNSAQRSLHRGFDVLLKHRGEFGNRPYFPILYYSPLPASGNSESTSPLRLLNLFSVAPDTTRHPDVLDSMQKNLTARGALNEQCRLENRFELNN